MQAGTMDAGSASALPSIGPHRVILRRPAIRLGARSESTGAVQQLAFRRIEGFAHRRIGIARHVLVVDGIVRDAVVAWDRLLDQTPEQLGARSEGRRVRKTWVRT